MQGVGRYLFYLSALLSTAFEWWMLPTTLIFSATWVAVISYVGAVCVAGFVCTKIYDTAIQFNWLLTVWKRLLCIVGLIFAQAVFAAVIKQAL